MSKPRDYLKNFAKKWAAPEPHDWTRHRPAHELKAAPAVVQNPMAGPDDAALERLVTAYRASCQDTHYGSNSPWRHFFESRHTRLHEIFMSGPVSDVRKALSNPAENDLFYGFDNLFAECTQRLRASPPLQASYAQVCLDDLLRCAEALGVVRCEYPESAVWKNNDLTADEVLAMMENALGIRVKFPNPYPGEFGLATNRGIAGHRAVHSLYLALRVKDLVKGIDNPKIVEIGAGLGRPAYYLNQFSKSEYEIVDLPFTAISQGYFLMTTLGADRVMTARETGANRTGMVKLRTPGDFLNSTDHYDLVVNVDSLTEVGTAMAQQYWNKIETSTARFLSINHEFNSFTVKELYEKGRRVCRVSRHPCWIRRGYIEELIEFA